MGCDSERCAATRVYLERCMAREIIGVALHVSRFFAGDLEKAWAWFHARNPLLGGISPLDLIATGRVDRLATWVEEQVGAKREEATDGR